MTKAAPPKFSHAELYHKYAEKYDVYKESIKRLVSYVKDYLNDPKVIYDVAAGTGMTSSFLLSVFPNTKIIAIDKSPEMIGFMKSYINNNNVERLTQLQGLSGTDISAIFADHFIHISIVSMPPQFFIGNFCRF